VVAQGIAFLDEERQVTEGAVFHDQVDMCGGLLAVYESDDVRMLETLEDLYFGG
jgi:hypothetical protein